MTAPAVSVLAYFDLSSEGGDFFTLDNATKGVLDNVTYVLAGDIATDITEDVTAYSITRGRDLNLHEIEAGQATISLNNHRRQFDPTNFYGDYFGNIRPGKRVDIVSDGISLFSGTIDDINLTYDVGGDSRVEITLVDALARVAATSLIASSTAAQRTGARVTSILQHTEVGFGSNVSIDTGDATLQADLIEDDTNTLQYLQLVARTEMGYLFADRRGVLVFRRRWGVYDATAAVILSDGPVYDDILTDGSGAELTTPGGALIYGGLSDLDKVSFHGLSASFGTELLYNRTITSRAGGSTEIFTDLDSAELYGVRTLSTPDLLFDTDAQTYEYGLFLLGVYSDPDMRVSTIDIKVHALPDEARSRILGLDITDLVRVVWTPNGVGDPLDRYYVIEGVSHSAEPASHVVTLRLGEAANRSMFRLDDAIFGVLDGDGILAF